MKIWRRFRKIGEAALLCLGFAVIPFLPRRVLVSVSRGLGSLAFVFAGKLRRIGRANLDVAFRDTMPQARKDAILKESFQTFALLVLDLFWFNIFSRSRIPACFEFDVSFNNYLERAPVVGVTAHFGNWEVMGQAAALQGKGPLSVATPLDNAFVDWMLRRWRSSNGMQIADRSGAVKTLVRLLKKGGRTALLMDQNTVPEEGGMFVDFFGLPVPVSRAAYSLAVWSGAGIVPAFCCAGADGLRYTAYCFDVISVEKGRTLEVDVTQAIATATERAIREKPGKWLWMYKRWKYIPEGAPAEKYPFYARKYERKGQ